MLSFEQLMREHDALAVLADTLEKLLVPSKPNPARAIALRSHLCVILTEHLGREDAQVYPSLIASPDGPTADIAQRFWTEYHTLTTDIGGYLAQWTEAAATADWPGFCRDTRAVLTRLRQRITDENTRLYPVALAASAIVLRVKAAA